MASATRRRSRPGRRDPRAGRRNRPVPARRARARESRRRPPRAPPRRRPRAGSSGTRGARGRRRDRGRARSRRIVPGLVTGVGQPRLAEELADRRLEVPAARTGRAPAPRARSSASRTWACARDSASGGSPTQKVRVASVNRPPRGKRSTISDSRARRTRSGVPEVCGTPPSSAGATMLARGWRELVVGEDACDLALEPADSERLALDEELRTPARRQRPGGRRSHASHSRPPRSRAGSLPARRPSSSCGHGASPRCRRRSSSHRARAARSGDQDTRRPGAGDRQATRSDTAPEEGRADHRGEKIRRLRRFARQPEEIELLRRRRARARWPLPRRAPSG